MQINCTIWRKTWRIWRKKRIWPWFEERIGECEERGAYLYLDYKHTPWFEEGIGQCEEKGGVHCLDNPWFEKELENAKKIESTATANSNTIHHMKKELENENKK